MVDFKVLPEHLGEFKYNCEEHGFNTIVIAGPGMAKEIEKAGRLVQVRKNQCSYRATLNNCRNLKIYN